MATNPEAYPGKIVSTTPAILPTFNPPLRGQYVTLEPMTPSHIPLLFTGLSLPDSIHLYRLMGFPTISTPSELHTLIFTNIIAEENAIVLSIKANPSSLGPPHAPPREEEKTSVLGFLAVAYADLPSRAIEAGAAHGPVLAQTVAATEAHYLLLRHLMGDVEVPFRRVSWKTNGLNLKSRACAERLGYRLEGVWRNHQILEGGVSRDTAWFAVVEEEWGVARRALETWLEGGNFDGEGKQRRRLQDIRAEMEREGEDKGAEAVKRASSD